MYSLKDSLRGGIKRLGIEKKLREKIIVEMWDKLSYGELVNHSQGAHFTNGILFVNVSSPVWSQQLIFLKGKFIQEINRELGGNFLKDIRFQCGVIKKKTDLISKQEILPNWEAIKLEKNEVDEVQQLVNSIPEGEIHHKFKSFLIKGKKLKKWREDNGWKTCSLCSCLYPQEELRCPFCSYEKEIRKMLLIDPYLDWDYFQEKMPNLSRSEYEELKKRIITDLWERLQIFCQEEPFEKFNQEKAKKWVNFTEIYVILKTGLDLASINKEIVEYVLGQNMAKVFYNLKNKLKEGA